jgi:hypothetical protein
MLIILSEVFRILFFYLDDLDDVLTLFVGIVGFLVASSTKLGLI